MKTEAAIERRYTAWFQGKLMIQPHWQLHWQNSIWYAMAAELTRLGSRKDDRVAVHAAKHTYELMAPLFDYRRLSPKRLILLLERLATQSEWQPLPIPAEKEIGGIIAEDLVEVTYGRRFNYHLAPKLQRFFTAIHEAVPTLADEMVVYGDVLRRRWGQEHLGLLDEVRQRIPLDWQLDEATVFPVFPVSGGGGWVQARRHSVAIEALPNTFQQEPSEARRLAWLLAQLAVQESSQQLPQELRPLVKYALIPAVLAAANPKDWNQFGEFRIGMALQSWCPELGEEPFDAAFTLWTWCQQADPHRDDWLHGLEGLPIPQKRWFE